MPSVTLLIPALNEARRIGATLETVLGVTRSLPEIKPQILVIDDGSRDATPQIVADYAKRHPEIFLVSHPTNRGLGEAFRTGLTHATSDKLLIVPGDNDMPAGTLHELLRHADDADLVMCFFTNREQRGRVRNLLSTAFGLVYATCFDIYVQYINGPCVYPVARLRDLTLFSTRFSIVAEINVKLLRQGVSFLEIASTRQTGLEGSTSFSLRNLRETLMVFARLCYEIHGKNRARYRARPRRVILPPSFSVHVDRA